jgi:hypothetical protein
MMVLTARTVVKNKFWVVERDGKQIATIQTTPDGVTYVDKEKRENFVSIKLLKNKYNITIAKERKAKLPKSPEISREVYGFPCDGIPHNPLLNLVKKLPVYTKTDASKSFYCAGYYLVKLDTEYEQAFCPKLMVLNRNDFIGPFKTKSAVKTYQKLMKEQL